MMTTAGELTHQHVGRTIQVKVSEHITVEDELEVFGHGEGGTVLLFKTVTPDTMDPTSLFAMISALSPKRGFLISSDTPVLTASEAEEGDK
jgi:hypothetical protein